MNRKTAEALTAKALRICATKVATVRAFLEVLVSKLIQYDKRQGQSEMKRSGRPNIYRMGLLLEARNAVKEDMERRKVMDLDTPEAMAALKASMGKHFTENFSPVKNVNKQIDNWLASGKLPSLVK